MSRLNKSSFFVVAMVSSCLLVSHLTIAQLSTPQLILDSFRPIRFNIFRHRLEDRGSSNGIYDLSSSISRISPSSSSNSNNINQVPRTTTAKNYSPSEIKNKDEGRNLQATNKDHYRASFSEPAPRHAKLEHVFNTLDRLAYTISKPTVIMNAMRLFTMVISSLFMSIFMIPVNNNNNNNHHHNHHGHHSSMSSSTSNNNYNHQHREYQHHESPTRRRGKAIWNNILDQLNRSDVEGMIELITRNYDETFERAGIMEKLLCKERYRRNRRR